MRLFAFIDGAILGKTVPLFFHGVMVLTYHIALVLRSPWAGASLLIFCVRRSPSHTACENAFWEHSV